MTTTTTDGLRVPNQDGSDHVRHWEHYKTLADSAGERLPRMTSAFDNFSATMAAATTRLSPTQVLSVTSRGPGGRLRVDLSVYVETLTANGVQTVAFYLANLVGATIVDQDPINSWRLSSNDRVSTVIRRSMLLEVTAAAGSLITAQTNINIGSGSTSVSVIQPRVMTTYGVAP